MPGFVQKELKNVITLYYLLRLDKQIPTDSERIVRRQNKKIHKVMKRAYQVPFYRERFDACGLTPDDFHCAEDLTKFPITTREDLRAWMQDEIEKLPPEEGSYEMYRTSGSSGKPLRFVVSRREIACVNANWIRVLMFCGYHPLRGKMLSFLTTHSNVDPKEGDSWVQKLGLLRRRIVPEHKYTGEGIRQLIDLVNDYQPDMLCFRKNVLSRMATYARRHNLQVFQPKAYIPIAEMVDETSRRLFLETFGPGLADAYGCNELGSCALRLPGSDAFYVYSDTHVLNTVDDEGQMADEGRVIGTTLYKFDYPIINYEVGDRAVSELRDGVRWIRTISGRSNDMVRHADGVETSAIELMKIPNGITGIAQFRYVQRSTSLIEVLLVPDARDTTYTREQIEEFFVRKVDELYGGHEFELSFCWLDEIPPDENGKMRCFVREIA